MMRTTSGHTENKLSLYEDFFEILGDVDDEVSHLLQFAQYIHIVDTGLIVLPFTLDSLDFGISKIVPEIIDAVLCSPELIRFIP